jgi:GMP synthase (glutamine-hydrolysing)
MLSGSAKWDQLLEIADSIFKNVPGINRCIWNLTPEIPTSACSLAASVTKKRLDLLREADFMTMQGLKRHGLYHKIWQCPTVFLPLEINKKGSELVVLRPIHSERAMTARAAQLPGQLIKELANDILALPGISGLALDITSKPPGTIEWE